MAIGSIQPKTLSQQEATDAEYLLSLVISIDHLLRFGFVIVVFFAYRVRPAGCRRDGRGNLGCVSDALQNKTQWLFESLRDTFSEACFVLVDSVDPMPRSLLRGSSRNLLSKAGQAEPGTPLTLVGFFTQRNRKLQLESVEIVGLKEQEDVVE